MRNTRNAEPAGREQTAREEILRAAAELFMDLGYKATSIDAIAERMGATKGRVYHYYGSKAEIFFDIQLEAMKGLLAVVRPIAAGAGDPAEKLERMARAHVEILIREASVQKVAVKGLERELMSSAGLRHTKTLREIMSLRDEYEQIFAEVIDEGTRRGLFEDLPPRLLTKPFFGALNWLTIWYRPRVLQTEDDTREIVDALAGFVMRGIRRETRKGG